MSISSSSSSHSIPKSSAFVPAASAPPASKTRKFNETSKAPAAKKPKTVAETDSDENSEREIDDSIGDPDYQSSSMNGSEDDEDDSLESFVNQAATAKSTPASNVSRKLQSSSGKKSTPRIPVVTTSLPSGFKHYIIEGTANGNFCSVNMWLKVFKHMFKGF